MHKVDLLIVFIVIVCVKQVDIILQHRSVWLLSASSVGVALLPPSGFSARQCFILLIIFLIYIQATCYTDLCAVAAGFHICQYERQDV